MSERGCLPCYCLATPNYLIFHTLTDLRLLYIHYFDLLLPLQQLNPLAAVHDCVFCMSSLIPQWTWSP
jgi:hypothetical protein